jgi:hypothetical protein
MIKEQTYELELSKKWIVHSIFHVSLLESYKCKPNEDLAFHLEIVLLKENEKKYKVKKILNNH